MTVTINGTGTIAGLSTGGLPDGSVDADSLATGAVTSGKLGTGSVTSGKLASGTGGKVVQVVNFQSAAVATGTTAISRDTSTPQISEGVEYMTLAITPTNASNKLYVEVTLFLGGDWELVMTGLLFNTTYHTTNALAAASVIIAGADHEHVLNFSYYVTAGTTSATTFRVRGGQFGSATTTFNGRAEAVEHGSAIKSSITITEISA